MQKISGFARVDLTASDLDRSAGFYSGLLGLAAGSESSDSIEFSGLAQGAGSAGAVRLTGVPPIPRGRPGIGGLHHVAFGTTTWDALLIWKRFLTDRGVGVSGPYDRGYFQSIYFRDPDGQVLEIATEGPGYSIDESPDQLGTRETFPPAQILAGNRDEGAIAQMTHERAVAAIPDDLRLRSIHHVSGITDSLTEADAFLQAALGLNLIKRTVNRDDSTVPHWFWARYDDGQVTANSAFTLFEWPATGHPVRPGAGQATGITFSLDPSSDALASGGDDLLQMPDGFQIRVEGGPAHVGSGI